MEKLISFIKKRRFDVIVTCSVIAFVIDLFFRTHSFSLTIIALYVLGYAADGERSQNNIQERKRLALQGITQEDLNNIKFVRKWEEIRKRGLIKYSVIDGGIFFGFALCGIISLLALALTPTLLVDLSSGLSNMLGFIVYTYIAGAFLAVILYRIMWFYKEQKFIRLTDPLQEMI